MPLKPDVNYDNIISNLSLDYEPNKHIMLVYDDVSNGRKIEFEFIKNGLEKDEVSIYFTHGDEKLVENEMASFGIDVKYFKNRKTLKIVHIASDTKEPVEFLDNMRLYLDNIMGKPERKFRIVGRAIPDVGIETAIAIQVRLEKIFHNSIFEKLNGSVLCTYHMHEIKQNDQWMKWLNELKENHHLTIICKNGKVELFQGLR